MRAPELTIPQILRYADEFHASTGRWPTRRCGRVTGGLGDTWCAIDLALRKRGRGLSIKSSLPQLLQEYRSVRNRMRLPKFTISQILKWADAHHTRTGAWPTLLSGNIPEAP